MKRNDPEHPEQLERKGQIRLMSDLGRRDVPRHREPKPDKGADDLPLFVQSDERQGFLLENQSNVPS